MKKMTVSSQRRLGSSKWFLAIFFCFSFASHAYVTTGLSSEGTAEPDDSNKSRMYLSENAVQVITRAQEDIGKGETVPFDIETLVGKIHSRISNAATNMYISRELIKTILEVKEGLATPHSFADVVRAVEVYLVREAQITYLETMRTPQPTAFRKDFADRFIVSELSQALSARRIGDIIYDTKPEFTSLQLVKIVLTFERTLPALNAQDIYEQMTARTNRFLDSSDTRLATYHIQKILDISAEIPDASPEQVLERCRSERAEGGTRHTEFDMSRVTVNPDGTLEIAQPTIGEALREDLGLVVQKAMDLLGINRERDAKAEDPKNKKGRDWLREHEAHTRRSFKP